MFHCLKPGQARQCATCANTPIHQLSESRRQTVSPTVPRNGMCKQYIGQIKKDPKHG